MEQEREKSTNTKVLISCYEDQAGGGLSCRKCGLSGHKKAACPAKVNFVKTSKADSDDTSDDEEVEKAKKAKEKEIRKQVRDRCGKCSICNKRHTFTRKRDGKEWPSDLYISCPEFQEMSPKDSGLN